MKILIPIDFSENSVKALELALSLNRKQKSKIILVHIVELVYDFASQAAIALDSMHKDAKKLMNELEKKYQSDHLTFQKIIEEGTASISIAQITRQYQADLIVIGTSGAGGLKRLVTGSTTINLLKETTVPVLVVPAGASISHVKKLTLAMQYSNHEKKHLDLVIAFKQGWGLKFEILHINSGSEFKDELAGMGMTTYLKKQYNLGSVKVTNLISSSTNEGMHEYFELKNKRILVMCHQHKNLWKHFMESSHSLAMAYQSHVPILVMN